MTFSVSKEEPKDLGELHQMTIEEILSICQEGSRGEAQRLAQLGVCINEDTCTGSR